MKMRSYEFEAADGRRISRVLWENEVPDAINCNDHTYLRVRGGRVAQAPNAIAKNERHLALSLPRAWQKTGIEKVWPKYTPIEAGKGGGIFYCEGKRDRQEFEARLADMPGYTSGYRYDKD